ncbi:DUF5060 domain-containing protein, partial [candidate division KSB1 bacterium]
NNEPVELDRVNVFTVCEISFKGPAFGPADMPAEEVDFWVRFQHESGTPTCKIHGFWDGDGSGGTMGKIFKIRFCPTSKGKWYLSEVFSNRPELLNQKEGDYITAAHSSHKGFWIVDTDSPGSRWYKRTDGSHQYIFGNTHYTFISERSDKGPNGSDIASDVKANAEYFTKLRFGIHGGRYFNPLDKPFFNNSGQPTDNGNYSYRPNPKWFYERVDLAVQTAYERDIIADLIINGPDTEDSRSILKASENGGDAAPFLKYIAARYGSYPNVWICLSNEWNIKTPKYSASQIKTFGNVISEFLPYPTPLSVHSNKGDWNIELNTEPSWNDHVIIQYKLKDLSKSADAIDISHSLVGGNKPVINDELAYEGEGDGWSEQDVLESHLGAFLGGGYGTTGYKPVNKKGSYFWGSFNAFEHKAADNLLWLREKIDSNIKFWNQEPVDLSQSIFENINDEFRAMQWKGHEYLLGTDKLCKNIKANLPPGTWEIKRFDVIAKEEKLLDSDVTGTFNFDAPDSRAVLFFFKKN